MTEPSHCALQVIRVEGTRTNVNDGNLRVRIKLGDSKRKTGKISNDGTPGWHDTFTFPRLDPSTVFGISLKKSRRVLGDELVGCSDVSLAQLDKDSSGHEVRLTRLRFDRRDPEHAATVVLSYREIDAISRASIEIGLAEQSVERINNSVEKPESAIAVIGSMKEVVDTVVEVVDKVSEIHPLFEVSWKAASALYKLISHQYENDVRLVGMDDQMRNAHDFTTVAKDLKDDGDVIKPKLKELLDETARKRLPPSSRLPETVAVDAEVKLGININVVDDEELWEVYGGSAPDMA